MMRIARLIAKVPDSNIHDCESRKKWDEPAKWFATVLFQRHDLKEWPIQNFIKGFGLNSSERVKF